MAHKPGSDDTPSIANTELRSKGSCKADDSVKRSQDNLVLEHNFLMVCFPKIS